MSQARAEARPLRILMLAPEPFFEPRGTPFSELHRIKALVELGHSVDLVTYPIGRDVPLPHLRIFRALRPPFVRHIAIGPSATKVLLDALMLSTVLRRALTERYDAIHSHEEMGIVGVWLARWLRVPHLYDMHSSLPQQLSNFKFSGSRLLRRVFEQVERQTIAGSGTIITICKELQDAVTALGAGERALLIENVMGGDVEEAPLLTPDAIRSRWHVPADAPVALYTGTFEAYQGLELLLRAAAVLEQHHPTAHMVIVGGEPAQIARAEQLAGEVGARRVHFTGQQPAREIPAFIATASVLVSPRIRGTNTPLKIYSYLRSGRPIVATDLLTHTQVLSAEVARLVAPEPEPLAQAIAELLASPDAAAALASAAQQLADARYSRSAYLRRTADAYALLMQGGVRNVGSPDGTPLRTAREELPTR